MVEDADKVVLDVRKLKNQEYFALANFLRGSEICSQNGSAIRFVTDIQSLRPLPNPKLESIFRKVPDQILEIPFDQSTSHPWMLGLGKKNYVRSQKGSSKP